MNQLQLAAEGLAFLAASCRALALGRLPSLVAPCRLSAAPRRDWFEKKDRREQVRTRAHKGHSLLRVGPGPGKVVEDPAAVGLTYRKNRFRNHFIWPNLDSSRFPLFRIGESGAAVSAGELDHPGCSSVSLDAHRHSRWRASPRIG